MASSQSHKEEIDNLTDKNLRMEGESIKLELEDIKEENRNSDDFYCTKCYGDYKGYCMKCSTLSYILNNTAPLANFKSDLNGVPKDILESRDTAMGKGVFLLKAIPKNVIFGPFEDISAIKTAKGHSWLIRDKKLVNIQNGNWMKDVCAMTPLLKNLDIFQFEGNLYFKTNREIMEGEELLVSYDDEEIETSSDGKESYFIPQKMEKLPVTFACTLCCLGFSSDKYLAEHKSKCPYVGCNRNIEDFEMIECCSCKLWLEKQEYQEHHMTYCWEKYHRMSGDHPESIVKSETSVEITNENETYMTEFVELNENNSDMTGLSEHDTKIYDEKDHLQLHIDNKRKKRKDNKNSSKKHFQCGTCMKKYTQKSTLKRHIEEKHNSTTKELKCSKCKYQTNNKSYFKIHLHKHSLMTSRLNAKFRVKSFKCNICMIRFARRSGLNTHMQNKHTVTSEKKYKCSKSDCSYQTNIKSCVQRHLDSHENIKPFSCNVCGTKFSCNRNLLKHMKNQHPEPGTDKDFKCSECPYQTNYKDCLTQHVLKHKGVKCVKRFQCDVCLRKFTTKFQRKLHKRTIHDGIRPFECDVCMAKFGLIDALRRHKRLKHEENAIDKIFKCSESGCSYETNYKQHFESHLNMHRGIKPFECLLCSKKYTNNRSLTVHMKDKHSEPGTEKDYKCSECSYQTFHKRSFASHLNTHYGLKPYACHICPKRFYMKLSLTNHLNKHNDVKFECDVCMMKFSESNSLRVHKKYKHSETGIEKDYKCSQCSYQTFYKSNFTAHLKIHNKPFECDICATKFTLKVSLIAHRENKHPEIPTEEFFSESSTQQNDIKPFECDVCLIKFTLRENLTRHIRNKHGKNASEKKFKCPELECSYQTNFKQSFQQHVNKHYNVRPFECNMCSMNFTRKTILNAHIKDKHRESGTEKDYKCPDCPYQTNYKPDLKKHLIKHSDDKAYQCDACGLKYTRNSSLVQHKKNKHPEPGVEKDYKCSECSYQTNNKPNFTSHVNKHNGIKPYECDICGMKFTRASYVTKHKNRVH